MANVQYIKVNKVPELEYLTAGQIYCVHRASNGGDVAYFRDERRDCGTWLNEAKVVAAIARGHFEIVEAR